MTIFEHPIFRHLRPYFHLGTEGGRDNVDLLQLPDHLRALALEIRVNCTACGAAISPFRVRAKSHRSRIAGSGEERRLFYAGTCAAEKNSGCARTVAARDHKILVRRVLGG